MKMHCEGKLKLTSHNTSYCLIEVVTKAGLTILFNLYFGGKAFTIIVNSMLWLMTKKV